MKTQPYFEDIRVGEEIPHQVREPLSTRGLVKWAAAVRDFYEVHYDKDFARSIGLRDVIAHGPNKCALLGRLMTEWIGEAGRLHRLSCTHKASNFPGETLVCRGAGQGQVFQRRPALRGMRGLGGESGRRRGRPGCGDGVASFAGVEPLPSARP